METTTGRRTALPAPDATMEDGGSRRKPTLWETLWKGMAAGLAGGAAMALVARLDARLLRAPGARTESPGRLAIGRLTNGPDRAVRAQTALAGAGAQFGACAVIGGVSGLVQSRLRPPALLHGMLLGGLTSAALYSSSGLLPRLGAAPPLMQRSIDDALSAIDATMTFGLTTAFVHAALERR